MYEKEKKLIIEYANKLIQRKLTTSTGGNISIYIRKDKVMLITPTFIEYHLLKVDDIVEMRLDGEQLSAMHYKPSSEWRMHSIVYKNREDINVFIHAHAVHCAVVSTFGPLPAIDYLVAFGGSYEIPRTDYATYGSMELANNSWKYLKDHYAVLLRNHGINTIGATLVDTFMRLELLEFCSQMYVKASAMGKPDLIDRKEMMKMVQIFHKATYGDSDSK